MNTVIELPTSLPQPEVSENAGFGLPTKAGTDDIEKLTSAIARLETDLVTEREDRREKEFIFVAAIAFLGSVICFRLLDNTILSIILFLFELVILTGLATRMGVDWAVRGCGWLTHVVSEHFSKSGSSGGGDKPAA
jgi:hypothetical protein